MGQRFCRDIHFLVLFERFFGRVIVTGIAGEALIIGRMTGLTGQFALLAVIQCERVLDQFRGLPCLRSMAVLALRPEKPCMDLGLLVAGAAFGCGIPEVEVFVAGGAVKLAVFSGQREERVMVEAGHAVGAVVALEAVWPHNFYMGIHKGRVCLGMATRTR